MKYFIFSLLVLSILSVGLTYSYDSAMISKCKAIKEKGLHHSELDKEECFYSYNIEL
jgi:hypothetical protein